MSQRCLREKKEGKKIVKEEKEWSNNKNEMIEK